MILQKMSVLWNIVMFLWNTRNFLLPENVNLLVFLCQNPKILWMPKNTVFFISQFFIRFLKEISSFVLHLLCIFSFFFFFFSCVIDHNECVCDWRNYSVNIICSINFRLCVAYSNGFWTLKLVCLLIPTTTLLNFVTCMCIHISCVYEGGPKKKREFHHNFCIS